MFAVYLFADIINCAFLKASYFETGSKGHTFKILALLMDSILMTRMVLGPCILTSLYSYRGLLLKDRQFAKHQKIIYKKVLSKQNPVLNVECALGTSSVPPSPLGVSCPLFQPLMQTLSRCLLVGTTWQGLASRPCRTPSLELPESALEILWAIWVLCID